MSSVVVGLWDDYYIVSQPAGVRAGEPRSRRCAKEELGDVIEEMIERQVQEAPLPFPLPSNPAQRSYLAEHGTTGEGIRSAELNGTAVIPANMTRI